MKQKLCFKNVVNTNPAAVGAMQKVPSERVRMSVTKLRLSMEMRQNLAVILVSVAVLQFLACKSQPEPKADETAARNKPDNGVAVCVDSMVRARQCTHDYIPTLVATRVRLDRPTGIAKFDADAGRQAVIDNAQAEWANDSKDEAIAMRCASLAKGAPSEMVDAVNRCMTETSCANYSQCLVRATESTL